MGFLIFLGIALILIIILIIAWHLEKKRSEALEAIAKALNFSFIIKGDLSAITGFEHFDLFSKGHSKKLRNLMSGHSGDMDISIMDYKYTVGHGKNSNTYNQTVIAVKSNLNLPAFKLGPEYLFHKIGSVFGYQDIDFDSHPKFSKQYLLQGPEVESVKDFFSDELLEFYEQRKGISTEAQSNKFIYYAKNKKTAPKEIQKSIQEIVNLYGIIKKCSSGLR